MAPEAQRRRLCGCGVLVRGPGWLRWAGREIGNAAVFSPLSPLAVPLLLKALLDPDTTEGLVQRDIGGFQVLADGGPLAVVEVDLALAKRRASSTIPTARRSSSSSWSSSNTRSSGTRQRYRPRWPSTPLTPTAVPILPSPRDLAGHQRQRRDGADLGRGRRPRRHPHQLPRPGVRGGDRPGRDLAGHRRQRRDGAVRIWAADGIPRATLTSHRGRVYAVAIAPDGTWLATAGSDRTVRTWAADGTPAPSSPATTARCARWRSPRTGPGWPPPAATGRCGSGPRTAPLAPPSPATTARCARWRSPRTGPGWPPAAATGPCGSGPSAGRPTQALQRYGSTVISRAAPGFQKQRPVIGGNRGLYRFSLRPPAT